MKLNLSAFVRSLAAVAILAAVGSSVQAAIIVNAGDELEASVPTNNDFKSKIDDLYAGGASVWTGTLSFTTGGTLTFYYHGAESGFTNSFQNGSTVLKEENNEDWISEPEAFATLNLTQAEAQALVLRFTTTGAGGLDAIIGADGFGIFRSKDSETGYSFFASDGRIYFGYDDNGAGPDDNHDDMIISALWESTEPALPSVPEPATLAVWTVLSGIGLVASRRFRRRV